MTPTKVIIISDETLENYYQKALTRLRAKHQKPPGATRLRQVGRSETIPYYQVGKPAEGGRNGRRVF